MSLAATYAGLRLIETSIAKAVGASHQAQIDRIEALLYQYAAAEWDRLAARAVERSAAAFARGARVEEISSIVNTAMRGWEKLVGPRVSEEMADVYQLAREWAWERAHGLAPGPRDDSVPVKKASVGASFSFDLADKDAIDALQGSQLYWIGRHYDDNVAGSIRAIASEMMLQRGEDRVAAAKVFRARMAETLRKITIPDGYNGSAKGYFEGLIANAVTSARMHGQLRSLGEAQIERYEFVAVGDDRTCAVCSHMDGKIFSVKNGLELAESVAAAKSPEEVKKLHPWLGEKRMKQISPAAGKQNAKDARALQNAGFCFPPLHFACRCAVDMDLSEGYARGRGERAPKPEPRSLAPRDQPHAPAPKPTLPRPPKIAKPPVSTARAAVEQRAFKSGPITTRKPLGGGVNATERVTYRDPVTGRELEGVWKTAAGEEPGLRDNITAGSYYKREAAAYELDRAMGGKTVVPPTFVRNAAGEIGSVQRFEGGIPTYEAVQHLDIDRVKLSKEKSIKRMWLFDVLAGHSDRHEGNVLMLGRAKGVYRPVAIDNGLAFPSGDGTWFRFPDGLGARQITMKLDAERIALVNRINVEELAKSLKALDLDQPAIEGTLVRVRALQLNPNAIAQGAYSPDGGGDNGHIAQWIDGALRPDKARAMLGAEEYGRIRRLAAK